MYKRVITGTFFALILGFLTFAISQAQTIPEAYGSDDCGECHEVVTSQWENSIHNHASEAEAFVTAWTQQGSPPDCLRCHTTGYNQETGGYEKEGIACETCHPSNPAEHPQKIMHTDISAQLCGQCHVATFADWETSQHGEEELSCARCHNPHSNELRAGNMEDTCRACHKDETHFFTFTPHAEEGLTCTDCHFQTNNEPMGNGHSQHSHTFSVGSDACTACHNDEMHQPGNFSVQTGEEPTVLQASFLSARGNEADGMMSEPLVNSSFNFAILAALIGMAFGLVGSPWLEQWQQRFQNQEDGGSNAD